MFYGRWRVQPQFSANPITDCGSISPKMVIPDVSSTTHDAGTDNAEATFTDPMDTYINTLVTSDEVVHGRRHVQSFFPANQTIDFWIDV